MKTGNIQGMAPLNKLRLTMNIKDRIRLNAEEEIVKMLFTLKRIFGQVDNVQSMSASRADGLEKDMEKIQHALRKKKMWLENK